MPFIRDQTMRRQPGGLDEEAMRLKTQPLGPSAAIGAPGMQPTGAPATPGGGRFVGLQQYLQANKGGAEGMVEKVAGGIERRGESVLGGGKQVTAMRGAPAMDATKGIGGQQISLENDAEEAANVQRQAGLAGTVGGREELLKQNYGQMTSGESALAGGLLGAAGGERLGKIQGKYGGLSALVQKRQQDQAAAEAARRAAAEAALGDVQPLVHDTNDVRTRGVDANAQPPPGVSPKDAISPQDDPNQMSDDELKAGGYMHSPAPGETYAHFSARIEARKSLKSR